MVSADRLKSLKIFREIPAASLERLAGDIIEKEHRAGDIILKEGDLSGSLYLIASGSVNVQKKLDREGERFKVVARLEAEEFFGEMSFLENQPHSATIAAQTDVRLFVLPRASLDRVIGKDPKLALEQIVTLLSGVSSRLRRTTRELVTVFEVARVMGQEAMLDQLVDQVTSQLWSVLRETMSVAFYRWNPFNDEYALLSSKGPDGSSFPATIEAASPLLKNIEGPLEHIKNLTPESKTIEPLRLQEGDVIVSRVDLLQNREGLFIYHSSRSDHFDSGDRQLMETVSAMLAPALATARGREEEASKRLLQERRQRYEI